MKLVLISLALALGVGCARFTTKQIDLSYDPAGAPIRTVTTKATAWTFVEGKSALANFKATQTDKTQSASVGSLSQESNAGTNIVGALTAIVEILKQVK